MVGILQVVLKMGYCTIKLLVLNVKMRSFTQPCRAIYFQFVNDMNQLVAQYHQISNMSRTLVGNRLVGHSDVVGASPVGAAQIVSSFST